MTHRSLEMSVGCSCFVSASYPPTVRSIDYCSKSRNSLVSAGKASSVNTSQIPIHFVSSLSYASSGNGGASQLGSIFLPPLRNRVNPTLVSRNSFLRVYDRRFQICRLRTSLSSGLGQGKFHGRQDGAEQEVLFSPKLRSRARTVAAQASAAGAASAPPAPQNFFARLWASFVAICASFSCRLQSIRIGWLDLLTMLRIVLLAAGAVGVYVVSRRAWAIIREKADGGDGAAAGGGDGDGGPMQVLARGATCLQSSMGPWSIADMTIGLTAMAKVTEKKPPPLPGKEVKDLSQDSNFLLRAQHWRAISEAVYAKDSGSFSLFTSLPESSLVASAWEPCHETFRPAFAVFVDPPYGAVVLAVRGTSHIIDMLLNSGASPEPFGDGEGYAHGGFVHAAKLLYEETVPHIEKAFKDHVGGQTELKLVVVGHSMGAAVGALISLMLREKWPDLQCWGYCPPACMSLELAKECRSFATTFVAAHDVVPRISYKSVEKLRTRIQEFDWDEVESVAKDDEDWQSLKKGLETFHKLQKAKDGAMDKIPTLSGETEKPESKDGEDAAEEKEGTDGECGVCDPPPLHPPGKLLVMGSDPPGCGKKPEQRSGVSSERNYGAYPTFDEARNVTWKMFEAQQEDMEEIVVSPWLLSDHMLGNMCEAIGYFQSCCSPAVK